MHGSDVRSADTVDADEGDAGAARSPLALSAEALTCLAIGVAALAVRLVYWAVYLRHYTPTSDANQYVQIATNFAHGRGISDIYPHGFPGPTAFRPPLYPATVGALFKVFGDHVAVAQAANAVLGAVVAVLAYKLTSRIAGRRAGLVAAAVAGLSPTLIPNDVVPLSESLSLVLFLAIVILLLDGRRIWAGLATGLLLLTRPSAPGLLVAALVWLLVTTNWRATARFVVAAVVVITPWVVRNDLRFHTPVLVTSNGFNVTAVYSPEALADHNFVDATFDARFARLRPVQANEAEWDRALLHRGIDGALGHPGRVAEIVARNAAQMSEILPWRNLWAEQMDGRNIGFRKATLPVFYLIAVLGVAGFWRHRRSRPARLLLIFALALVVPSVFTVVAPRLRAPLDLALAIGVGLLVTPARDAARDRPDEAATVGEPAAG